MSLNVRAQENKVTDC